MQRIMCKSKIHRARVTDANLNYEGSLTIDTGLMRAANILPFEKVQIVNINNGSRAETYVIEGKEGSGEIVANGALARMTEKDDLVIIISYAVMDDDEASRFTPSLIHVNEKNEINR